MKIKWKQLAICILIPLALGGLSAWLTMDGMQAVNRLEQPALSPPSWLFYVVWPILYVLMGVASYLVYTSRGPQRSVQRALSLYAVQLAMNFLWTLVFFNLQWFLFAFLWLLALWALVFVTMLRFYALKKAAGWLLLPYWLWLAFAGYLNLSIWLLN